jgi:hypothetical protein
MKRIFSFFAITALLQACTLGPQRIPLLEEDKKTITNINAYNLVIQDEMTPYVDLSNLTVGLGGGLLVAMIDATVNKHRSEEARSTMDPFYLATADIDYRELVATPHNLAIAKVINLKNPEKSAQAALLTQKELNDKFDNLATGEALYYAATAYRFIDQAKRIHSVTAAFVYTNPDQKKIKKPAATHFSRPAMGIESQLQPVYYNSFAYQSEAVGNGLQDSIDAWSSNSAEKYLDVLKESIEETAKMIAYDLANADDDICINRVDSEAFRFLFGTQKISGNIIGQSEKSIRVRLPNGSLYSIDKESVDINTQRKSEPNKCITQKKGV